MTNWGILGLGRMGTTFAEAINEVSGSKLISIASKSGKIFKKFENKSYDYVINNENISMKEWVYRFSDILNILIKKYSA